MRAHFPALALLAVLCAAPLLAQRVSPYDSHVRIAAVIPRAGAGTQADPHRPLHFPVRGLQTADVKLLGWASVASPDGLRYFVEFVVRERRDARVILEDPQVVWVDRKVAARAQVELMLRGVAPLAQLDRLKVRVR